jgi:hypothetical protein
MGLEVAAKTGIRARGSHEPVEQSLSEELHHPFGIPCWQGAEAPIR